MRANDVPVKDIIDFLNDNKYKNSRNRPFNKNSLQHLFNNKKYIGTNTYGKEQYPNAVPAIIDEELFEKVQNIKEKYKHAPGIRKATERYLLTGKLFCRKMSVALTYGMSGNSKSSTTYRYYRCNKKNDKGCKNKAISKDYIEDKVVRKLKTLLTEKNIEKISKKIYETCQKENNSNVVIKNLEKKKKQINKNIDNLLKALEERTTYRNDKSKNYTK